MRRSFRASLLKPIAVALCLSMLAACAGQDTSPRLSQNSGFLRKISDDPTLAETRAYLAAHPLVLKMPDCGSPAIGRGTVRPAYCNNTPPPPPDTSWDYSFMPGNGMISVTYGPYTGHVSGSGIMACAGQTGHQLAADATALAAALQNTYNSWSSDANAAQLDELIGAYAAGEIGAAAFIAGAFALDAVAAGIAVAAIGLAAWSLFEIAMCVSNGGPTSYLPNPSKRMMDVAFASGSRDPRLRIYARFQLRGKRYA
ncbi:MAG TPA: hypothetical protein VNF68_03320 [Candidatus Baltobacteraceae bacterium]|nr:hypothetical protein [Candidatus Baltobacteraceae bacterium]